MSIFVVKVYKNLSWKDSYDSRIIGWEDSWEAAKRGLDYFGDEYYYSYAVIEEVHKGCPHPLIGEARWFEYLGCEWKPMIKETSFTQAINHTIG